MKLFNQSLEIDALKTICCGDANEASSLLGGLDESFFATEIGQQAFARIQTIARERTKIISWGELVTDPCLSEEYRSILKSASIEQNSNPKGILNNLDKYRKARILMQIGEHITESLTSDKIDVDEILDSISQSFVKAKTGKSVEDCFTTIGQGSNTKDILRGILTGESLRYFPTGFKQWDDVNSGLPLGKLGIIAATSGGGKSLCINQLALNLATQGVSVCIVPLEMSKEDMLHRFMANVTDLDMGKITKSKDLTDEQRASAFKQFRQFEKSIAQKQASIKMFHPDSDMSMEDVLFSLKPFNFDVVMIDYLGLLGGLEGDNQWKLMMDAARFAKRWAESNDCTVLCAAQLNEDQVIRYSKGTKEHSDFFWGWNAGKLVDNKDGVKVIKIESQKGRNQEQITFYLHVDYRKMLMVDATKEEIEEYEKQASHKGKSNHRDENQNVVAKPTKKNAGAVEEDLYADI